MKIYVDEMPKDCIDCPCESEYYCNLLNEDVGCCEWGEIHKNCPLQLLADHDKKVRAEVVAENQALKERWEKLKDYIEKSIESDNKYLKSFPNNMNFENYRTTKMVILETMKELEKGEVV